MVRIVQINSSIFGGLLWSPYKRANAIRLIFYFGLILFFEIFFYIKTSQNAKLIGCGVMMFVVFFVKLVLYFLHLMVNTAMELSNSEPSAHEERPDRIPPEVWEARTILKNPKPNLDAVVSDLIASGIDANGLILLVEYLRDAPPNGVEQLSGDEEQNPVINICGHLFNLPFSRATVERVFPTNFTIDVLILSVVFGFSCSYLPLSLFDQFDIREKWWVAIVCGISIYSILRPPEIDPYQTHFPDSWTGCSRPVAISILSAIWRVTLKYSTTNNIITKLPFYGWTIDWSVFVPYVFDICRYGIMLLPLWMMLGYVGHPVTTIATIIESFNRYAFGQCGGKGLIHLTIQLIRGALTVAAIWGVFQYKVNGLTIAIGLTISALLGGMPILFRPRLLSNWITSFSFPILVAGMSFIVAFCIVDLAGNNWEIISWFSFGWFMIVDVIFPYISSNHQYFIVHLMFIGPIRFSLFVRNFSQFIVGPLFIASCLNNNIENNLTILHPLTIAFIITHAVQKLCTEPQIFTLAIILTVVTFPEFGYNDSTVNFLLSLLISAKVETTLPLIKLVYRSRDPFDFDEDFDNEGIFCVIMIILYNLGQTIPSFDFIVKIPSLFWSFITGASYSAWKGLSFFLLPGPPRPYYFFDWPVSEDQSLKSVFTKNVSEHPIETPVYTSASRTLCKEFATFSRAGRLGLVQAGDIYLFKADSLAAYIHVISIEPSVTRIQVRGLEYNNQTSCHSGENRRLDNMLQEYEKFPNFLAAKVASHCVFDIRSLFLPLEIFDVNMTKVDMAFLGIEAEHIQMWFFYSFCYVLLHKKSRLTELRQMNEQLHIYTQQTSTEGNLNATNNNEHNESHNNNENNDENNRNNGSHAESNNDGSRRTSHRGFSERELMMAIAEEQNVDLDEEEQQIAQCLWSAILSAIFDPATQLLKYSLLADAFKGSVSLDEQYAWIYNAPGLISDVIQPAIQLGCGVAYFGSSGAATDVDGVVLDVLDFIRDFSSETIVTTLDSDLFRKTFFEEKKKKIICLDTVNSESTVIRFSMDLKEWSVFQMKEEWMRALWSSDERDMIFYQNKETERNSIQHNSRFLNNMIMQAADSPVGYPAYVSDIMDSYPNHFSFKKYI